jgi:hypothetical protein
MSRAIDGNNNNTVYHRGITPTPTGAEASQNHSLSAILLVCQELAAAEGEKFLSDYQETK